MVVSSGLWWWRFYGSELENFKAETRQQLDHVFDLGTKLQAFSPHAKALFQCVLQMPARPWPSYPTSNEIRPTLLQANCEVIMPEKEPLGAFTNLGYVARVCSLADRRSSERTAAGCASLHPRACQQHQMSGYNDCGY